MLGGEVSDGPKGIVGRGGRRRGDARFRAGHEHAGVRRRTDRLHGVRLRLGGVVARLGARGRSEEVRGHHPRARGLDRGRRHDVDGAGDVRLPVTGDRRSARGGVVVGVLDLGSPCLPLADQLAARLRSIRRDQGTSQRIIASATDLTSTAVSRLERGHRRLRVDLLVAWVGALGYRVDVVIWRPAVAADRWDSARPEDATGLDDNRADVLAEVASGVGFMPGTARHALVARMRAWKEAAIAVDGSG